MATFKATIDKTVTNDEAAILISWASLAASGDIGDTQSFAAYGDKTFIVSGTFTGTPTVVIEGSNDGTNWFTLANRQGLTMSFTAAGMNTSQDRPIYIRPRLSAGSGGAVLQVSVAVHRIDFAGIGR